MPANSLSSKMVCWVGIGRPIRVLAILYYSLAEKIRWPFKAKYLVHEKPISKFSQQRSGTISNRFIDHQMIDFNGRFCRMNRPIQRLAILSSHFQDTSFCLRCFLRPSFFLRLVVRRDRSSKAPGRKGHGQQPLQGSQRRVLSRKNRLVNHSCVKSLSFAVKKKPENPRKAAKAVHFIPFVGSAGLGVPYPRSQLNQP